MHNEFFQQVDSRNLTSLFQERAVSLLNVAYIWSQNTWDNLISYAV